MPKKKKNKIPGSRYRCNISSYQNKHNVYIKNQKYIQRYLMRFGNNHPVYFSSKNKFNVKLFFAGYRYKNNAADMAKKSKANP